MKSIGLSYGIGTYIEQMINIFRGKYGLSLNIVELYSDREEFCVKEEEGCFFYYFPKINASYVPYNNLKYSRSVWYILQSYIKINEFDELILQLNFNTEIYFAEYFRDKYPLCKIFYTIHHLDETVGLPDDIDKAILKKVDTVICLAKCTCRKVIRNYDLSINNTTVIPNGLKDEYSEISDNERCLMREKMGFSKNDILLLFAGRVEDIKGLPFLIEAVKRLSRIYPEIKLIITGNGAFDKYMGMIQCYWSHIVFTGMLDKKMLYQLYQIVDIGVLPFLNEQCSYVAIEMMMHCLPIVIAASECLSEMLELESDVYDASVNICTNEVSIDDLENAIVNVLKDVEYSHKMRQLYENKFSFEMMEKNYLNLYGYEG